MIYPLFLLIFVSSFVSMMAIYSVLLKKRHVIMERLERYSRKYDASVIELKDKKTLPDEEKSGLIKIIDRLFPADKYVANIQVKLTKARLQVKPEEFIVILLVVMFVMGLLFYGLFGSLILAFLGLGIGYRLPFLYLGRTRKKIARGINDQLPDVLTLISNGLRAGLSFSQSIVKSINDIKEPLASDFKKLVHDTVLGKDLDEALEELAQKADDEDVDMFITSISINRQVGGNLAEVLDTLAETVRERVKLKGDVRRMIVQSKMSAGIIGAIPFVIFLIMFALNRQFIEPLYTTFPGYLMLGAALFMQSVGVFIIIKIINTKI